MLVYRGGKVLGPISLRELEKLRRSTSSEVAHSDIANPDIDFVITREKGWIPLDTFMSWAAATGEITEKIDVPDEVTELTSVYSVIPWKFLLSLALIMGAVVGAAWWLTR